MIEDGFNFSLLNPITRSQIPLPVLNRSRRAPLVWKIFLSSDPSNSTDDCIVIHIREFAFCGVGDDTWSTWTKVDAEGFVGFVDYNLHHKGRFFLISNQGSVAVVESGSSPKSTMNLSPGRYVLVHETYVVKAFEKKLLLVLCNPFTETDDTYEGLRVEIFKLDLSRELKWSKVASIGDHAMFLSRTHSSVIHARGISGFREDCIYFGDIYRQPVK